MSRFPGYAVRMGRSAQVLSPRPSTIQIEDLDAGVRWLVGEQAQEQLSARDKSVSEEEQYSRYRWHSRTTRCGKTGPSTGTSFPDVSAFV